MTSSRSYLRLLASCFASCIVSIAGCGTAGAPDATTQMADRSGTLSLPLTTSANGHTYRVRNAFVSISGPTSAFLSSTDDPLETVLSATLSTGAYSAQLFGWQLERSRDDGSFAAVQATLVSSPFVQFTVYNGTTTTISFSFQTDGILLTVGSGNIHVAASVDEVAGVCTPFESGCAEGTWCPPPELTGQSLACVAVGSTAIGAPCTSPLECVANASCIDLGAGPVCVELCPTSAAGTTCPAGGTCLATADGYGTCN